MNFHELRSSFNSGEISPLLDARVDIDQYRSSCRRLENFIPRIYGGAFRRPGMMYLGAPGDGSKKVMLIPFNVSATVRYVLELGDLYCRVWNADGTRFIDEVNSPFTNVLQLTTIYAESQLFDVKYVQLNNVAYFVHPSHPAQKLTRSYDADQQAYGFVWSTVAFDYPCFRSRNETATTATPSATTGSGITIAFDSDVFNEGDAADYVGSKIRIVHKRDEAGVDLTLGGSGTSGELVVFGDYEFQTTGSWSGTITLEFKDKAGNWEVVRAFESQAPNVNYTFLGTAKEPGTFRFVYSRDGSSGSTRAFLRVLSPEVFGMVEINSITYNAGLPTANVDVIDDMLSTDATTDFSLEAWAPYAGYPRAIAFHEQRLWFGGTAVEPNAFWASNTDDFENFRRDGVFDSSSLAFTLAAQEGSAIQSMLSHESLLLFTQTEEWTASTSEQTAITPTNIFVRRQSRRGSAFLQSLIVNNDIIFLQRGGRDVLRYEYSTTFAGGKAASLTILSEHLTRDGIKQMAFQLQPDPILWMVTNSGDLIALTYEENEGVVGWSKHPTSGTVESVAVIYGDSFASDEVWLVVNRTNGRAIERLNPGALASLESNDLSSMVYVDSAVAVNPGDSLTVSGLTHLEGQAVSIVADTYRIPDQVVVDGEITLTEYAESVTVGLPYTSIIQPSKMEIGLDSGTAQDRRWICKRVVLNLWRTLGLEYADDPESIESDWFGMPAANMSGQNLYDGLIELDNRGDHKTSVEFAIRQNSPFPANVLALIAKFNVQGS